MDTYIIPIGVKTYMAMMRRAFKGAEVFLVGGALAPHKTNDFDIVILSDYYSDQIINPMKQLYEARMFDAINIYKAYDLEVEDKSTWDDGKFHTKCVCDVAGTKMDFLFCRKSEYPSIYNVLDGFPLSIQMQAVDFEGNLHKGARFNADKIVCFYGKGSPSEKKYRKYYPDKDFIYDTDIESREGTAGVQEEECPF